MAAAASKIPRMEPIYGPGGEVVAWNEHNDTIRDLKGRVVGWLYDDAVQGVGGHHVGYFNDGLFRDNRGAVVAWVASATGGPTKPVRHVRPVQPVRHVRPVRAVRHVRHVRAVRAIAWSEVSITAWLPLS